MGKENDCPCVKAERPVAPYGKDCWHFTATGWKRCRHCWEPAPDASERAIPKPKEQP